MTILTRCFLAVLVLTSLATTLPANETKPNVIIVITDDQGYGDLGCHGNPVLKTPNLDMLSSDSVRFTDFHVSPFCTPTRAALMTGNHPGYTGAYRTSSGRSMMHNDEKTIANLFGENGYATGMVGKWHLGDNAPHRPQDRGFKDVVWHRCGGVGQASDYWRNDYFDDTYERNGKFEKFEGYCTDVWFREGMRFVEDNKDKPFLLYLALNAPHGPYRVPPEWAKPYVGNKNVANPNFYGMVANIDHNMGLLRSHLDRLGLTENTILIFMTDNGTASGAKFKGLDSEALIGYNAGMRGKKSSVYDGGHRVPFFIHWPGGGLNGGKDVKTLSAHIDVLPTLAELCEIQITDEYKPDGVSLKPLLDGSEQGIDRDHHVVQFHGGAGATTLPSKPFEYSVVMTKRWRLVSSNGQALFDIAADPAQRINVAEEHPDVVSQLRTKYDAFWEKVSPRLTPVRIDVGNPTENPTTLCSQDWMMPTGNPPWNFGSINKLPKVTGPWMLDVKQAGPYRITLRQFPKEANKPVVAVRAKIEVGGKSQEKSVEDGSKGVVFEMELPAGPTELVTSLYAKNGKSGGAYFTEVEAIENINLGKKAKSKRKKPSTNAGDFTPDRSVTYKTVGDIELKLHVFEPTGHKANAKSPAIVFFFGGGWAGGNPNQFFQQARALADKGMVAFSADYRVKGKHKTTPFDSVKDAKSAVRWIRQHASELGIDPDKIVASGGSAGGHIAACTGVIVGEEEEGEDLTISSIPNAMILYNPVLDTTAKGYGLSKVGESRKTDISPCHHVRPGIVPTLTLHGTADTTVPFENAERFDRLMKEAGNQSVLESFEGQKHGFFNGPFFRPKTKSTTTYEKVMKTTSAFLTSHGYLSDSKTSTSLEPGSMNTNTERTNFVIFVADDMGWGDSGTYGHKLIKTPNLDKLAAGGVKLTQCYSACAVCSPSRSAILTGRHPYRNGVWRHLSGNHAAHLRASEITYPKLLKSIGYETCHVGKWHLNSLPQFNTTKFPQPGDHGYDYWMTTHNNAHPSHKNPDNFVRNGQPVGEQKGYSAQIVAAEATKWLSEKRDKSKPFALSVWVHEPHSPIATDPKFADIYGDHANKTYMGNISQLDAAVGSVMQTLEQEGVGDNTFFLFTSDNGPVARFGGTTGGLRGGKRSDHEGGIRVPGIVSWPGHIAPGTTSSIPIVGTDIFTTVLDITGVSIPEDRTIDGVNMLPALSGKPVERPIPLFWRTHVSQPDDRVAMRVGDWKIVGNDELTKFQLYEIEKDWKEENNLAASMPEKTEAMKQQLMGLWDQIKTEGPNQWWEDERNKPKKGAKLNY